MRGSRALRSRVLRKNMLLTLPVLLLALVIAYLLWPVERPSLMFFEAAPNSNGGVTGFGISKYYGGFRCAAILRVDDFIVDASLLTKIPDSLKHPSMWFINYEEELVNYFVKKHPEARLVFALITGCVSGEYSKSLWRMYERLVKDYGWEAAAHTRMHDHPPRSQADIAGCVRDIEGNITGYKVLTYIPPFGEMGANEKSVLEKLGVKICMKSSPLQLRVPQDWFNMHYTIRMKHHFPWSLWLWIAHRIAERRSGVVVVCTHATSYDWCSPSELIRSFEKCLRIIEDGNTWITTPSYLYNYVVEACSSRLVQTGSVSFLVYSEENMGIPLTLVFI